MECALFCKRQSSFISEMLLKSSLKNLYHLTQLIFYIMVYLLHRPPQQQPINIHNNTTSLLGNIINLFFFPYQEFYQVLYSKLQLMLHTSQCSGCDSFLPLILLDI